MSKRLHLHFLSHTHTHRRTHAQVAHLDLIKHGAAHYQHTFLRNYFSPVSRQDIFLTLDKPISVFFFFLFFRSFFPLTLTRQTDSQLAGRPAYRDQNITFSKLNLELNELLKKPREIPLIFTGHNVEPWVSRYFYKNTDKTGRKKNPTCGVKGLVSH